MGLQPVELVETAGKQAFHPRRGLSSWILTRALSDTGRYIPDQQEPVIPFPTQDTGINETPTIGPNFWKVASNFNAVGMKYIPQIPLVITNTSEIIAWANSSYHILGRENIQALEIGNEPDHYGNTLAPGLVGVQTPLS